MVRVVKAVRFPVLDYDLPIGVYDEAFTVPPKRQAVDCGRPPREPVGPDAIWNEFGPVTP
jgi:hypothetical protein